MEEIKFTGKESYKEFCGIYDSLIAALTTDLNAGRDDSKEMHYKVLGHTVSDFIGTYVSKTVTVEDFIHNAIDVMDKLETASRIQKTYYNRLLGSAPSDDWTMELKQHRDKAAKTISEISAPKTEELEDYINHDLYITRSLSGHMYHNSPYETDSDCGNCDGARCDECHEVYAVNQESTGREVMRSMDRERCERVTHMTNEQIIEEYSEYVPPKYDDDD